MDIRAFKETLDALPAQSVLQVGDVFRELVPDLDLDGLLVDELNRCVSDYRYTADVELRQLVVLARGRWFELKLMVFENEEYVVPLATVKSDSLYCLLTPAEYSLHELVAYRNDDYSSSARAILRETGRAAAGDVFAVEASRRILTTRSPEPVVALILANSKKTLFSWDFDRESGMPMGHYNNFPGNTAFELMAKLLGAYGDGDCVPHLQRLLEHRSDTVKWQAAHAIMRIDSQLGLQAFRALRHTGGQDLARAARLTLEQCGEPN